MTGNDEKGRAALDRLAEALVEDILAASDEDILAEFKETHGDPAQHAFAMREAFEKTLIALNKNRLSAAKLAVAAKRTNTDHPNKPVDIASARRRLQHFLDTPDLGRPVTIAARKESELSDSDVLSMLKDLEELDNQPDDERDK